MNFWKRYVSKQDSLRLWYITGYSDWAQETRRAWGTLTQDHKRGPDQNINCEFEWKSNSETRETATISARAQFGFWVSSPRIVVSSVRELPASSWAAAVNCGQPVAGSYDGRAIIMDSWRTERRGDVMEHFSGLILCSKLEKSRASPAVSQLRLVIIHPSPTCLSDQRPIPFLPLEFLSLGHFSGHAHLMRVELSQASSMSQTVSHAQC